ncbi:Hexose transporter 2 [Escovopsis weberi]|uniref:Hexose transporter 2 n=1 Tax=Escovopsis weberi TaxID=150374 RepID=A0A0M8MVU9_ESCWE|nr:Hexose transporter 2 [Escovopsis weberi]
MALIPRVPYHVWASIPASFVALLFGLDTGCIGPVTTMPSFISTFGAFSPTVHGAVVSAALIPGAITALIAGALVSRFGHAKLIALGSFIHAVGAAIECSSVGNLGNFVFGRLVKGIGTGLFLSNVFVQVSEASPLRARGVMMALPQFMTVSGLVLGYFICYGTAKLGSSSAAWRLPLAIDSGLGFLLSASFWVTPSSPRWLASKGRVDEALAVARRLDFDQAECDALVSASFASDTQSDDHGRGMTLGETLRLTLIEFRQAFSAPFRKRTLFGCFLMAMQQFTGIDAVLYYAPILFTQAGLKGDQATFLASGVTAIVILAATVLATIFANSWGRRTTSIVGGVLITVLMLLMGSLYAANVIGENHRSEAGKWMILICIYLFAITFSCTWAVSFRTFLVETMPRKTRSSASSLAQSCNWIANYIVAFITPVFLSQASYGAYYMFAGCSLLCTVVIVLYMVETKGYSLETIEQRYNERASNATGSSAVRWFKLKGLRHRIHESPSVAV